jgi:hypothetical protein
VPSLADAVAAAARELELEYAHEEQREIELTEHERWARDPVGWINQHVTIASVISNDGIRARVRPARMTLFPDQERTIGDWIDLPHLNATGELVFSNLIIEKSRQIGETWLFAAIICWLLLFHPGLVGGALHTVGAEIDDGGERNTPKSLFGKIRYISRRLPAGAAPGWRDGAGYALRFWPLSNQGPAKIENLANGAVIYGEGQKDDPFRGSTLDYVLVDEAARVRHGEQVHASIDDACPAGKAYLSTPYGDDNVHARLADERPQGYRYLRLHWGDHPVYGRGKHTAAMVDRDTGEILEHGETGCELCQGTLAGLEWSAREPRAHRYPGKLTSPWYEQRIVGKTDEQVASELDIDREGALSARVYAEFETGVHVVAAGIPYDPLIDIEFAWDFGVDATSIIVLQNAPQELRAIGLLEIGDLFGTTVTSERVGAALRAYLVELGVEPHLTTPQWTRRMQGIGDPAGDGRSGQSGISDITAYAKQGFSIIPAPRVHTMRVETTIVAVKRLLLGVPKPFRICGVNAGDLGRHLRNNTWPVDPITQKRRKGSTRPLDDIHNHSCRALAYYTVARFPPSREHDPTEGGGLILDETEPVRGRRSRRGVSTSLSYGMRL